MAYEDNGERYFHDSEPEFKGNIYTDKKKSEIRNLSKKSGVTFISFRLFTNYQAGDEDTAGMVPITVKAFGEWAEYILDNPDYFAPGKRVHVRGQLEQEEYEFERDAEDIDGNPVTILETRYNQVITINDRYGNNGFISPCFQFADNDGKAGGSRRSRRRDDDEDEAPRRSSRRARRNEDSGEDEAPRRSTRRSRRDEDSGEDEAPRRGGARRSRRSQDDEDSAPARPRRRRVTDGI